MYCICTHVLRTRTRVQTHADILFAVCACVCCCLSLSLLFSLCPSILPATPVQRTSSSSNTHNSSEYTSMYTNFIRDMREVELARAIYTQIYSNIHSDYTVHPFICMIVQIYWTLYALDTAQMSVYICTYIFSLNHIKLSMQIYVYSTYAEEQRQRAHHWSTRIASPWP